MGEWLPERGAVSVRPSETRGFAAPPDRPGPGVIARPETPGINEWDTVSECKSPSFCTLQLNNGTSGAVLDS